MSAMIDIDEGDRIEVLSEGPPVVYKINRPITFHSIGVITHRSELIPNVDPVCPDPPV